MLCDGLNDAELDVLIAELRAGYREAVVGGGVAAVRGEGRALEYTRANLGDLKRELASALREKARRDPSYDAEGALRVEF